MATIVRNVMDTTTANPKWVRKNHKRADLAIKAAAKDAKDHKHSVILDSDGLYLFAVPAR